MRIALVTESFAPQRTPAAYLTRRIVEGLLVAGHEVVVFTEGRGQDTFRDAKVFRASRLTPVSAISAAMSLHQLDLVHIVSTGKPHGRFALKVQEAAARLDLPSLSPGFGAWAPGNDTDHYHPSLRDQGLHDRWARVGRTDGDLFVAGYVGPLTKPNVIRRLEAIAELDGVRLVALGQGIGAKQLAAAGAKVLDRPNGLEETRLIASFDVLVQPRKKDVYVPAVHQALASGVPVVSFDTGTPADVVRAGKNGLLIGKDRGAKAFARAVAELAADPETHARLARNARASVSGRDWPTAVAELVDDHYRYAVERRSFAAI